jgi:hypothetical protein
MRSADWKCLFIVCALAPGLGACVTSPAQRHIGPSPVLDADAVVRSSNRIDRIMTALSQDAGGGSMYDVAEAGFNYVDDRCMEYFSELFYLNRRKEATKAGLGAFSQTSNAILAATGATGISMAIVAQAFGLASNLTDIAAGTYLYQLPPATTLTFVKKLQGAFRESAARQRSQVNSPATAYHLIQDYLSLCLPPTIEAKLIEHVSDATAVPARGSSVANIELRVGTENEIERSSPVTIIREVSRPLEKPAKPQAGSVKVQPNAVGAFETRLSRSRVAKIQKSLCVAPVNGVIDETTRVAVDEFFRGVQEGASGRTYPSARADGIQAVHEDKLLQGAKEVNGDCWSIPGMTPVEIGRRVS